ncbi:hypothetical protein KCU93_g192, partial [Aureobasidium melanogenum]
MAAVALAQLVHTVVVSWVAWTSISMASQRGICTFGWTYSGDRAVNNDSLDGDHGAGRRSGLKSPKGRCTQSKRRG